MVLLRSSLLVTLLLHPRLIDAQTRFVVTSGADVAEVVEAVAAPGENFTVSWEADVLVTEPMVVGEGSTLTVTGLGSDVSSLDGDKATPLFALSNRSSLHLADLKIVNGYSTFSGGSIAQSDEGTSTTVYLDGGVTISRSKSENSGGAISCSTLVCSGTNVLSDNRANGEGGVGGAVSVSTAVIFGNTTFSDNDAPGGAGGAISFRLELSLLGRAIITGNSAKFGGAIYGQSPNLTITLSDYAQVASNNATALEGGGIYVEQGSQMTLSGHAQVSSNTAKGRGGGIYAVQGSQVTLSDAAQVSSNAAGHGGGMDLEMECKVSLSGNAQVSSNRATEEGGGINAKRDSQVTLSGSAQVSSNTAFSEGEGGGGISVGSGSQVTLSGSAQVSLNRAALGGGICLESDVTSMGRTSQLTLSGSAQVSWNTATLLDGGGIDTGAGAEVTLNDDAQVLMNTAAGSGGGLYLGDSASLTMTSRSSIDSNDALVGGGGILAVNRNPITLTDDARVSFNQAQTSGGGISSILNANIRIDGNASFVGNSAAEGGGISISSNGFVALNNTVSFRHNVASTTGGAINLGLDAVAHTDTRLGVVFEQNVATFGGAIYSRGPLLRVQLSLFARNSATIDGGAVYLASPRSVAVLDSRFVENTAVNGGALFVARRLDTLLDANGGEEALADILSSSRDIERCTFDGNAATEDGGAIYVEAGGVLEVEDTILQGNEADGTGGAVFLGDEAQLRLYGLIAVTSNRATTSAGGIGGALSANITVIEESGGIPAISSNTAECCYGGFTASSESCGPDQECTCEDISLGTGGVTCCRASEYWSPRLASCEACDRDTMDCDKFELGVVAATIPLLPGYWKASLSSDNVRECPLANTCAGGVAGVGQAQMTDDYCREGSEGPYCAVCSKGYYSTSTSACEKCSTSSRSTGIVIFAVIIVFVVVLMYFIFQIFSAAVNNPQDARDAENDLEDNDIGIWTKLKRMPWTKLRAPIVTFQILTELGESLA